MSTMLEARPLVVVEGGRKTYRSVEVARKQEATSWEMADAIWEDFSSETRVTDENSETAEILAAQEREQEPGPRPKLVVDPGRQGLHSDEVRE